MNQKTYIEVKKMSKLIHSSILLVCISLLTFCKNKTKVTQNEDTNKIEYSNISFNLPKGASISNDKSAMITAIIKKEKIADIKIFNFGNKPILVEANIDRWKSQFEKVTSVEKEKIKDGLIHYIEIQGLKNNTKSILIAGIIPTDAGPYYLKSDCNNSNFTSSAQNLKSILKSIRYKK